MPAHARVRWRSSRLARSCDWRPCGPPYSAPWRQPAPADCYGCIQPWRRRGTARYASNPWPAGALPVKHAHQCTGCHVMQAGVLLTHANAAVRTARACLRGGSRNLSGVASRMPAAGPRESRARPGFSARSAPRSPWPACRARPGLPGPRRRLPAAASCRPRGHESAVAHDEADPRSAEKAGPSKTGREPSGGVGRTATVSAGGGRHCPLSPKSGRTHKPSFASTRSPSLRITASGYARVGRITTGVVVGLAEPPAGSMVMPSRSLSWMPLASTGGEAPAGLPLIRPAERAPVGPITHSW